MLPAPLQFVLAMIAYAINQRLARQLDYLQEEVRVLKEALAAATGKTRIDFSAEQRRRLAHKGKEGIEVVRKSAERQGFEPWEPLRVHMISKPDGNRAGFSGDREKKLDPRSE